MTAKGDDSQLDFFFRQTTRPSHESFSSDELSDELSDDDFLRCRFFSFFAFFSFFLRFFFAFFASFFARFSALCRSRIAIASSTEPMAGAPSASTTNVLPVGTPGGGGGMGKPPGPLPSNRVPAVSASSVASSPTSSYSPRRRTV